MIEPYGCKNVLIEGVTIIDSPYWVIHPLFCDNVIVRDVTIDSTIRTMMVAILNIRLMFSLKTAVSILVMMPLQSRPVAIRMLGESVRSRLIF